MNRATDNLGKSILALATAALLGTAAATEAADPWIQINYVEFADANFLTIVGFGGTGGSGASLPDPQLVSYGYTQNIAAWGNVATVFPAGTLNGVPVLEVKVGTTSYGYKVVNDLSAAGTSVGNVFILSWNPSTDQFTFKAQGGSMNGVVSAMHVQSYKIFYAGDFSVVGGGSNFKDFAVWSISSSSWDSYTAKLLGYDGYKPKSIDHVSSNVVRVWLDPTADAYGGIVDDPYGWQAIPWTTTWVEWNISGQYWSDWGDDDFPE